MLHEFITANRTKLIDRCRVQMGKRPAPAPTEAELEFGVPLFFDQLTQTLSAEQILDSERSREISGTTGGGNDAASEIGVAAMLHGRELSQQGFTIDQVVRSYGDVCQAISGLAMDDGAPITVDEFKTLNRCLDNATAGAVTEFARDRDHAAADKGAKASNERLGYLAHEMRNYIHMATLAMTAIKLGGVGLGGATGALVDRSLLGLGSLVDRAISDVRATAGMPVRLQLIALDAFIAEIALSASIEARSRGCTLLISEIEKGIAVEADRALLFSGISNLLQNAFKFTGHLTEVTLRVHATEDRVLIEVTDRSGGLPAGAQEKMFLPFTQVGTDTSGLGLGLTIAKRSVEANNGILSVRDLPGVGCTFLIDLPRAAQRSANESIPY